VTTCKACAGSLFGISAAVATLSLYHNQNNAFKAVLKPFNCLRWSYTANTLKTLYKRNTCKLRPYFDGIQAEPKQTAGGLPLLALTLTECYYFTTLPD
jgi:hypothetical protein